MKILHLYHKTYNTGDGITNAVMNLSYYQNEIPSVESTSYAFSSDDILKQKAEFNDVHFYKLLLKIKSYKPDYVYIHGIFKLRIPLLITILKTMGIKVILVPHCSLMRRTINHKKTKKNIYLSLFNLLSFRHVNMIHFLNNEEKNESIVISKKNNSYILPNGITPTLLKGEKNFSEIRPFYFGRCDIHHKGLDFLIESVNLFYKENKSDIRFNIYGANESQFNELEKLEPSKKIIINPPIFNEDKDNVLTNNNIFIMTSRYEGLPISILEALSYGNICLLTAETNMASIVVNNNCGFLIESLNDIPRVLNIISEMSKDTLLEMSNNARNLVANEYNWKSIALSSVNIIKNKL